MQLTTKTWDIWFRRDFVDISGQSTNQFRLTFRLIASTCQPAPRTILRDGRGTKSKREEQARSTSIGGARNHVLWFRSLDGVICSGANRVDVSARRSSNYRHAGAIAAAAAAAACAGNSLFRSTASASHRGRPLRLCLADRRSTDWRTDDVLYVRIVKLRPLISPDWNELLVHFAFAG